MLQRDYIEEMVNQFVEAVAPELERALKEHDGASAGKVEDAIAALLDLDPNVALNLSPDSLVTMMVLSGIGDSIAGHVAYSLARLGDAYEAMGDEDKAMVRRAQADAVATSFGVDLSQAPEGLEGC